jgi:hypothetical protein
MGWSTTSCAAVGSELAHRSSTHLVFLLLLGFFASQAAVVDLGACRDE